MTHDPQTPTSAPSAPLTAAKTLRSEALCKVYKKKTVVDFNDVTLEGELTKPEGSYLVDKKKARFSSLIKLRDNFLPELQKSVDNL